MRLSLNYESLRASFAMGSTHNHSLCEGDGAKEIPKEPGTEEIKKLADV